MTAKTTVTTAKTTVATAKCAVTTPNSPLRHQTCHNDWKLRNVHANSVDLAGLLWVFGISIATVLAHCDSQLAVSSHIFAVANRSSN